MSPDLLPFIIAGLIGLGIFFIGLIVSNMLTDSTDRVSAHLEAEPAAREQNARVIRALGSAFVGLAKPFDELTEKLDLQLTYAGRPYGGVGGREYFAASLVLSVMIAAAVAFFFSLATLSSGASVGAALGAALRWFLLTAPAVVVYFVMDVRSNAARNSEDIEREFPFFLDLAVLVVQAGGTPRKALSKYVEASPGTALAREIAITAKDADSTSFDGALYRMIDRVQPVSVKTILKNLAQGEKTSGEAEQFYTDQAEELRYLREEMANRTAERLKANIVFPVFLLMTGVIIAALAPTIVSISSQGFF
jgi:tight adherence protein C